ncbi:hypothetical protein JST56_00780 [Candidatus Dependentiae bacterium]|nr:hypothetical protein [Candidatus Dependentiae bacterium]
MNCVVTLLSISGCLIGFAPVFTMNGSYQSLLEQSVKKLAFKKSVTYCQMPLHHAQIHYASSAYNNNQQPFLEFRLSDAVCEACRIGFSIKEKAWDHSIHMHLKCPWCTIPSFGKVSIRDDRTRFIIHVQRSHAEHGIFICSKCPFITTTRAELHVCNSLNYDDGSHDSCDDILLCCKYCRLFEAQDVDIFREHEEICSFLQDFVHEE